MIFNSYHSLGTRFFAALPPTSFHSSQTQPRSPLLALQLPQIPLPSRRTLLLQPHPV